MNIDKAVMFFAGVVIIVSLILTNFVHPNWVWLTVFAGFNMIQASFTGFCPAAILFKKCGLKYGCSFGEKQE